jgi:Domain of unknown function (DUF4331)
MRRGMCGVSRRCGVKKSLSLVALGSVLVAGMVTTHASSHREAPLISQDPLADNTDVYAFVSPAHPDKVTLIANYIPFEAPYGGPNFFKFDDNVLYEIMIDNDGDAIEDVTYQFRFTTEVQNPNTFLYNTGQITSLDDPDFNVRQYYTVTEIRGPRRTGSATILAEHLPTPPVNVGVRSIPNYAALGGVHTIDNDGTRVFAGQRDDPFFVNLGGTFDLLGLRVQPGNHADDGLAGFNVHSIALELPMPRVTHSGAAPTSISDPAAIIGVWATASRQTMTTRVAGGQTSSGNWVQVSRLGQPLVNEVVIPLGVKDAFNGLQPTGDGAALPFVLDPEMPKLLEALLGVVSPPAPRNDLVTIFLTGIPGLNQPPGVRASEMLRLNMAVPPSSRPEPMGVLDGDIAGFPNGRRLTDDVVDIALRAMAGATPLTPAFNHGLNARLGDGVDGNDEAFLDDFPYMAIPHPGNDGKH